MIYMNKYIVKTTPSFEKELKNIYKHLSFKLKEPMIANKFYNKVIKEISSLQYFPERYTKISSYINQIRNLRKLLVDRYVVIYEVNHNTRTSLYLTHFSL